MSTIFQPPPSNLTTIASIMTSELQTVKASIQWMSPEHEKSLLSNFLLLSFCLPAAASVNLTFGLFYLSHQHRWPAPDRKLSPSNGKETTIFLALTNQSCQNTVSWTSWNRVHTLWKWRKFECSFAVYNLHTTLLYEPILGETWRIWGCNLLICPQGSRFWLPSILNVNSRLCTVIWLRFIMWQWLLNTFFSPVGLSNEQASGVGSVEQRSECRTLSIRGLGKAKACPPSPLLWTPDEA